MRKRIISTLMALCMALTLLPVQVLAADYTVGEDTSVSARALAGTAGTKLKADNIDAYVANGLGSGVYTLTEDVTINGTLTVTGTVTLDLNDHVLTITGEDSFITVSGKNTSMTLTDSAKTKTERKFSVNQDGVWVPDENGDQTVSGGVITGGKAGVNEYGLHVVDSGVRIENHGTLTVTDGTINAPVINEYGVIAGSGTLNGTVANEDRISGGTFYAGNPGTVANGCCTVTYDYGKADGTYAIQIVQKGEAAIRPADPKLNGFDFSGWLENGTPYGFTAPVTGDLTLTAGWRRIVPGSGTEQDPYRISNAEELQAFRDIVSGENGQTQNTAACAVLTADIDLENQLWTPIGIWQNRGIQQPYSGTFDGGGYAIRNLYVNNSEAYTGLFGSAHNATFRNLTITGSVTANNSDGYSGGLLGRGTGTLTITNCINAATVTSSEAAGGLVGIFTAQDQSDTLTITGCANLGTVTAKSLRAGIIGQINGVGVISDCYNAGEIKSSEAEDYAYAGGIAAWASLGNDDPTGTLTFRSCYNVGALKKGGVYRTGGIVGRVIPNYTLATERYRLENCYYLDTTADKAASGDYTAVGEAAARTAAAFADGTVLAALIAGRSVHPWDNDCGSKRLSSGGMRLPVLAWQKLTTEHEGGTATCASGAVCEYCGRAYGAKDAANHTGITEVKNAKAATCTADGYTGDTYCKGCGVKLRSGTVDKATGHTWGAWTSNGDGTHTRACKRDGTHTETKDCSGGTATCSAKAVCAACGKAYGKKDADNHDLKHVAAKAPGTYVRGNTEYWQCRDCGKYFADARAALEIKAADVIIYPTGGSTGGKSSPTTFDAGIGVCAVTAFTSLTGLALLRRKRRDEE